MSIRAIAALVVGIAIALIVCDQVVAADLLVADRLSNSVFRYSESGALLGTVVNDEASEYLNQPTGIGISPDYTKLYVSSSQNSRVVRYDYNRFTGAATNPTVFADASDGLTFPSDILFSADGSVVYVSNLSGSDPNVPPDPLKLSGKVARFHVDGSSAGSDLIPPQPTPPPDNDFFQVSSLSFHPTTGQLLVGAFQDFPGGTTGGIAISDPSISSLPSFFTTPSPAMNGATGLMVHDGYLYVSNMFAFSIRRISLTTGQLDPAWGISNVFFPQDLTEAPDGNGFLAGILGFSSGTGNISRYAFDGSFLGFFATPTEDGFTEATTFVSVPDALPGDFNNNGVVDVADYVVWRNAAPTDTLPNDDSPGLVDSSDYNDWRANYGKSTPGRGSVLGSTVPEPTSVPFLIFAIGGGSAFRPRRKGTA